MKELDLWYANLAWRNRIMTFREVCDFLKEGEKMKKDIELLPRVCSDNFSETIKSGLTGEFAIPVERIRIFKGVDGYTIWFLTNNGDQVRSLVSEKRKDLQELLLLLVKKLDEL